MASETEIAAMAMVLLGQPPIIDIDDTSVPNAVKCKAALPITRDAMLREYPWAFAIARIDLTADVSAPVFGYSYKFQLPADCLRVLGVSDNSTPYVIEGQYLFADVDAISVRYVQRVIAAGMFDSLFTECLAIRLARDLAYSILKKASMVQAMNDLYRMTAPVARVVDSIESRRDETDDTAVSSWVQARR